MIALMRFSLIFCEMARRPRQGAASLTGLLALLLGIGPHGAAHAQAPPPPAGPTFVGTCPPVGNSSAALIFQADYVNQHVFRWISSDSVLGDIDTGGFVNAPQWRIVGANPQRLVFRATVGGVSFAGDVLFEPHNRAVVDVVRGAKRIRYLLRLVVLDLDGDANHDTVIENNDADEGPEASLPGILTLCNLDDDDIDGVKDNEGANAATVENGGFDLDSDDFAPLVLRQVAFLPPGWTVELTLHGAQNVEAGVGNGDVVRIFADYAGPNAAVILGPGTTVFQLPAAAAHGVDLIHVIAGDITNIGFEGLVFAGEVRLKAELKNAGGAVIVVDELQLKVSPLLLIGHDRNPVQSFVSQISMPAAVAAESTAYCTARFPGATPLAGAADHVIPPGPLNGNVDPWAQDEFQIGFQQAPYAAWHVVLDSKRNEPLDPFPEGGLLGPDFGHLEISSGPPADSLDSFGNLEVTPPFRAGGRNFPFGRIYYGDNPGGNRMDRRLRDFWLRQRVTGQPPIQDPVTFNSDWLNVGHVDEIMSIVPDATGTHGWKVVLADPQLGVQVLAGGGGRPGVDPNLHTPRYVDFNRGGVIVDRASALLMRPLDLAVPGGSATIEDYNLVEANDILFGPPAGGHLGGLRADVRAAFGLVDNDFILVPVLFNLIPDHRGTGLRKAVAITPDLANGAVYPGTYIAPDNFLHNDMIVGAGEDTIIANFRLDAGEDTDGNGLLDTGRDPYHNHLDAVLPAGITATYIDDWAIYHLGEGEVHCSSNETRELPVPRWWE